MKRNTCLAAVAVLCLASASSAFQRGGRPAPPPSRYGYTISIDAKSLPEGVVVRKVADKLGTRYFVKNTSDVPLVINQRYQGQRLVGGTKLVSGKVYQYFPNGVPMQGKQHLKGWQAPFGTIEETLLSLPREPARIYEGRKPGLSSELPPPESAAIEARYDGKPHKIRITIQYHLNPAYDARDAKQKAGGGKTE